MKITRLTPVDIRQVWPTEPYDFTPWLFANPDVLSEVLGIDVELTHREHRVGGFSLDLLGRTVGDDDKAVIVENQFGATDHGHLGQIMTYAGGTDPAIVVWIAETFREEHSAALDWLNVNTHTGLKFFGIEIGAVRMEGAESDLVAPRLELVCKPNDWEKLARQEAAGGGGGGQRAALYKAFWTRFGDVARERGWPAGAVPAGNWWSLSSTAPGHTWSVSYMQGGCRSELYIDTGDKLRNEWLLDELVNREPELSTQFGDGLRFEYLPNRRACRLEVQLPGPVITEEDRWDEVLDWFTDTQARLRAAVTATGGLPSSIPPDGWMPPYASEAAVTNVEDGLEPNS